MNILFWSFCSEWRFSGNYFWCFRVYGSQSYRNTVILRCNNQNVFSMISFQLKKHFTLLNQLWRYFFLTKRNILKSATWKNKKKRHTGIPGLRTRVLNTGLWTLDSGLWTRDSELWTLDSELWTLEARLWMVKC